MLNTDCTEFFPDIEEVVKEFVSFDGEITVNGKFFYDTFSVSVSIENRSYEYLYDYNPSDSRDEKRLKKRFLKLSAYKALSDFTGIKLPWGALTGIRPTKLAYKQGDRFERFFKEVMLVSDKKTELIAKILETQKGIYSVNPDNSDLFISVPFCPSRCAYCSFISNEISKEKRINEYIDRLLDEIDASKSLIKNLRAVYIGGGTPVALSDELFYKLLLGLGKQTTEYTVEAGRPDAISEFKLQTMKDFGVTRVCVNPQTFSDKTLKLIGRKHTSKDVIEKYELVKSYGFDVNMDLIAGLYGETKNDFENSLKTAVSLNPENITVHTLCLKSGSKLKESTDRLSDGEVSDMVEFAHEYLATNGYNPYYLYRQKYMAGNLENTGYAKKGKECIYNVDIMEETTDILANGANAVSKRVENLEKITRIGAPKNTDAYLKRVDELIEQKKLLFMR